MSATKSDAREHGIREDSGDQKNPERNIARDDARNESAPRGKDVKEDVKVWEDEGGSPPDQISSTDSEKPKLSTKPGSMSPGR